ncbi:MAG TPA: hypothetical protein VLA45_11415, partial [Paracoccaceae bacterium]|nr:hypothetical protein [Paracoccaceae bacterium]
MALAFPLALDSFWSGLRIRQAQFYLPEALEINETGDGEVISADTGPRLWRGSATLVREYHAQAAANHAILSVLRQAGRSFFAYDTVKAFPAADPEGTILGASTPVIAALMSNNREMDISGLPASYVLSIGDYLSFSYGTGPVRHALHQVV